MKKIKLIVTALLINSYLYAECTEEQRAQMIINGVKQETIDKMCAAQPAATQNQPVTGQPIINIYQNQTNDQSQQQQQQQQAVVPAPVQEKEDIESWYFILGYGSANITYSTGDVSTIPERTSFSLEWGAYLTVTNNLIVGYARNVYYDFFDYASTSGNQYLYGVATSALSAVYYLDKVGKGLYFRGDIGSATLYAGTNYSTDTYESEGGIGTVFGVGYALRLIGTSFEVELDYASSSLGDDVTYDTSSLQVMGKILF